MHRQEPLLLSKRQELAKQQLLLPLSVGQVRSLVPVAVMQNHQCLLLRQTRRLL